MKCNASCTLFLASKVETVTVSFCCPWCNLEDFGERYPGELSDGQRQRVGIARGAAVEPKAVKGTACASTRVRFMFHRRVVESQMSPS